MIPIASCGDSGAVKEVKGYPVYKFMNFGGIDAKALKANEAVIKKYPHGRASLETRVPMVPDSSV